MIKQIGDDKSFNTQWGRLSGPYIDKEKRDLFLSGFNNLWRTNSAKVDEWRKEFELCNCYTCMETSCKHREKETRFPEDIGGACQCIRTIQEKADFAFRNVNGDIIVIPPEVVKMIRGE